MDVGDAFVALAKTGISGFALYTCYLSYKLVRESNESSNYKLIYVYMGFSLLLALVVLVWQILDSNNLIKIEDSECQKKSDCLNIDDDFFVGQNVLVFKEGDFSEYIVPGLVELPYTIHLAGENLSYGYKPKKIIRFIDGDKVTADGVSNGSVWLGDNNKKVVFAADYDELKGLPLNEVLDRIGGITVGGSVIAVIIDTSLNREVTVNPASYRGIYKWIRDLNESNEVNPKIDMPLNSEILNDIENNNGIEFHGLKSWGYLYDKYETDFMRIRENNEFISSFGEINYDEWQGHGYSQRNSGSGKYMSADYFELSNYGALGFLVKNVPLRDLKGVKIIRMDPLNSKEIVPIMRKDI